MAPKKKSSEAAAKDEEAKKQDKPEDPKKRKAEEIKEGAPAKKLAKKEEAEAEGGEKEKDDASDGRPRLKDPVAFRPGDCTLNVVPTLGGRVLMALSDGGMQYLIAGARAAVGVKAGRYFYELRIIEALTCETIPGARGRTPMPKQLVRIGFSVAGSSLVLGEDEGGVCFDTDGAFHSAGKKFGVSQRFSRDNVVAVLLNLDPSSSNKNTISLFRDGVRVSEPQALPEAMCGKPLFPHVSFRNVSVQVNFGPEIFKPLPFKCRNVQGAAVGDVEIVQSVLPKGGKCEVLLPVAFPDQGTFDWLDRFLEKNPHYVELSDRKIIDWACKSGFWRPKAGPQSSNDKPDFNFGVPEMDNLSVRAVINAVAPVVPRNYVIMEVKSNLVKDDRADILKRFSQSIYKKVAHVVMGEPCDEFKKMQQEMILKDKQEKATKEWKLRKAENEKKKAMELKQKQILEMRRKADENRKKAAEEAKRKAEEAARKRDEEKQKPESDNQAKEGEDAAMEDAGKDATKEEASVKEPKDEPKEEVKEEAKKEEEEAKKEPEEEEPEPVVELSEDEKKVWFRTPESADISPMVLCQSFARFTIPEKAEGFDEVKFEWYNEKESKEYLKKWVLEQKLSSRMEDLQPGVWFKETHSEFSKKLKEWQVKQKSFKATNPAKEATEKKEEERQEEEDDNEKDLDIFSVEDVCDIGNGEPLFANFAFEDWALLQLRFELFLLTQAFRKDANDPDRIGVNEKHFAFYYHKYFQKQISPKYFGVGTTHELIEMVKDAASFSKDTEVLTSTLQDDSDSLTSLLKLTEENRRERQRRIDAGDETARLKFSPLAMQQPQQGAKIAIAKPAGATAGAAATPVASAAARPTAWAQGRPVQPGAWNQARPVVPAVAALRAPTAGGRWPAPAYAPRAVPLQPRW